LIFVPSWLVCWSPIAWNSCRQDHVAVFIC
jgi:hypothetical protein